MTDEKKTPNKPRPKKLTPYQRIYRAGAIRGTGIHLTWEECRLLSMDDAIEHRAELDDQIDEYGENGEGETDKWKWFHGSDNSTKEGSDD